MRPQPCGAVSIKSDVLARSSFGELEMAVNHSTQWLGRTLRALLATVGLVLLSPPVGAAERTLTAVFKPDVLNPGHSRFVDTTPRFNYCENQNPACKPSIRLGISAIYAGGLENGAEGRQAFFFKVPSQTRTIVVTNKDGDTAEVQWRIDTFTTSVASIRGGAVFEDRANAPPPCTNNHVRDVPGVYWFDFQWAVPDGGVCVKRPVQDVARVEVTNFGVSYEMTTPDPLAMNNGLYTGRIDLIVGPGGDFDFGDRATANDSIVTFHFELRVEHQLTITAPPGSNRAILSPDTGWSQWVDHGRKPGRLSKEVPFTISSSSPFSVKLVCQYPQPDGHCGLRQQGNPSAPEAAVATTLTIPGLHEATGDVPVVNYPLSWTSRSVRLRSDTFLIQRSSLIHFEVTGAGLDTLLAAPGSHWMGNVTVVFDAQL